MARRSPKSLWPSALQRSLSAWSRKAWRTGAHIAAKATTEALQAATHSAPRSSARGPGADDWLTGVAFGPTGARRYRLYKPPGVRAGTRLPLLVLLHGCGQDAAGLARSTRIQRVAAREGFLVLCPEQERLANAQGCWNWFETRSGRAYAEAASIVAAVDQVCLLYRADPARVAIAGLSAGASMAALLAARHPARFKAVAMHSGVAPGAAESTATAIGAMQGRRGARPLPVGPPLPPLLVIQGSADHFVNARNGQRAAQLWADAAGATAGAPRTTQRGARRAATWTDYKVGPHLVASLCEVDGLGHAWSGGATGQPYSDPLGPDAARMIWAFVARRFAQSAAKQ